MDQFEHFKGSTSFVSSHESISSTQAKDGSKQIGYDEKEASVHEEMKKVNQLPPNSTYATHRLRILNKILQLLSIQNNITGTGVGVAFFWALHLSISANSMRYACKAMEQYKYAVKACIKSSIN